MNEPHARLIVARLGETIPALQQQQGPFENWILREMGRTRHDARVLCPHLTDEPLPPAAQCRAVVLSGSGAMITESTPWMKRCQSWLRDLFSAQVPIFGICFGHQLLATALGGRVANNPRGPEVGTVELQLTDEAASDPLFQRFSASPKVQTSHLQSVLQLPPGAVRLATTARDPNHAFRIGHRTWGVQFHPEFNAEAMRAYIDRHRPTLEAAGQNPRFLQQQVEETADAAQLLEWFDLALMEAVDAVG